MKDIKDLTIEEMIEMIKSMNRKEKVELYKKRRVAEAEAWYGMMTNTDRKYANDFWRQYRDNGILSNKVGISDMEYIAINEEIDKVHKKYSGVRFVGFEEAL